MERLIAENIDLSPEEIAEGLLKLTDQKGEIPTERDAIIQALGLKQLNFDFSELEISEEIRKKDIKALLSYNEKIIATDSNLKDAKRNFCALHEVAHYVLPEHLDKLYLCSESDLSYFTRLRLEAEANKFAADLIFQKDIFTKEANCFPLECGTITTLAPKYGASFEATGRRYVERHYMPCALIVYSKVPTSDSDLSILPKFDVQYTITSKSFAKRYFTKIIEESIDPKTSHVYKAYSYCFDATATVPGGLIVNIKNRGEVKFKSECFTSNYKVFRLVWPEENKP